MSPSGEIRFWDSLGSALSNVDRYQQVQLDLGDDEYADRIWALGVSISLFPRMICLDILSLLIMPATI